VILLTWCRIGSTANLKATCPIRADFHVIVTEYRSLVCVVVHIGLLGHVSRRVCDAIGANQMRVSVQTMRIILPWPRFRLLPRL
jgi:hypothetical protein